MPTSSTRHLVTTRWSAYRRIGAGLVATCLAANPHRAVEIGELATELGRGLCLRSSMACKRALRGLVRIADLVEPDTRFELTPAGAAALEVA